MPSTQRPIQQDQSSGSRRTVASRHRYFTQPIASKRVSFYKSGDPQFGALQVVINSRTFRTFDALLDSLSKKVPLPFGVRNITTPHGVHTIRTLEELKDGKAYICSDQKKVKPFDLEVAGRKLPPWYYAHPVSVRRRTVHLARQNVGRTFRRYGPTMLWTPKRLTVFRNGDPGHKHTVIVQKKTTPTFEALLDHVSDVLQFHVVKLHTADGQRLDDLTSLVRRSGVVVAAGREPFKPCGYNVQKAVSCTRRRSAHGRTQRRRMQLLTRKNRLLSRRSKTQNLLPVSQSYIVNRTNSLIAGSLVDLPSNPESTEMGMNSLLQSMESDTCTCVGGPGEGDSTLPPDDDIEKSFRVNPDGSMTVEMKVRLTITEEETVHWTTTVSRSSVANQFVAGCIPQNNATCRRLDSDAISTNGPNDKLEKHGYESYKESNLSLNENRKFCDKVVDHTSVSPASVDKLILRRVPAPGIRGARKEQASMESIETLSAVDGHENMVGTSAYIEETAHDDITEKYHTLWQPSSRPVAKHRRSGFVEVNNHNTQYSPKSSRLAEVLQIQDNGEEFAEKVLHVYEQQSYHDNFVTKTQFRVRSQSMYGSLYRQSCSERATCSSSNDSEVELQRPYTTSESIAGKKADIFSPLSDLTFPLLTQSQGLASLTNCKSDTLVRNCSEMSDKDTMCLRFLPAKAKDDLALRGISQRTKKKSTMPKVKKRGVHQSTDLDKKEKGTTMDERKNKTVKADVLDQLTSGKWAEWPIKKQNVKMLPANWYSVANVHASSENIHVLNSGNLPCSENEFILVPKRPFHSSPFNLNTNDTSTSLMKNVLDVLPMVDSAPVTKALVRQKSPRAERKDIKEIGALRECISMPYLYAPRPEPNLYSGVRSDAEIEKKPKVVLQVGGEEETSPEVSKGNNVVNRSIMMESMSSEGSSYGSSSCIPIFEKHSEVSVGDGNKVDDSCDTDQSGQIKLIPGVRKMTKCGTCTRIPARAEEAVLSAMTGLPDMRQQLCQSTRATRETEHQRRSSRLEKSQSWPDFSSHVTSTFVPYSKMLLACLSMAAATEGISEFTTDETAAKIASCTKALKLMGVLEKIAHTEHAGDLKASLIEGKDGHTNQPISNIEKGNDNKNSASPKTVDQQIGYKKESLDIEELATHLQDEAVCVEAEDTNAEDEIPADQCTCYLNKQTISSEKNDSFSDAEALYKEEQGSSVECKSSSLEEQDGFAEELAYCSGQQEEQNIIFAESLVGSVEKQGSWGEQPVSWLEDMEYDTEERCCSVGQKRNCVEKQEGFEHEQISYQRQIQAVKVQANYEYKRASPVKEWESDEEIQECYGNEQRDLQVKLDCHAKHKIHCAERFTNSVSYTEGEVSCEEGTFTFCGVTADATIHDNEWMIHEKEKAYYEREPSRKRQKSGNCAREDKQHVSSELEHDNVVEEQAKQREKPVHSKRQSHVNNAKDQTTQVKKQESHGRKATSYGKTWASYGENQISTTEKQTNTMNRLMNQDKKSCVEHSISADQSAKVDVPEMLMTNERLNHVSHDKAKIETLMKESPEVCQKGIKKCMNETQFVLKDTEDGKLHKKYRSSKVCQSVKTLQALADSTRPLSSSLDFSYDSKGSLQQKHEGAKVKLIKEMFLAKSNTLIQDCRKLLPSSNTSDLSDYRPETSDNGGSSTQTSTDASTESEQDDCGRRSIAKGYVRRTIERLYGKSETFVKEATGKKSTTGAKGKRKETPESNSVGSLLSASDETRTKGDSDLSYFNATTMSDVSNEVPQCIVLNGQMEGNAEILNERDHWLLLDNQLSGQSPCKMLETCRGKEERSTDTRLENGNDDIPYSHFGNHQSPLAAMSCSDLQEIVQPAIPKCTYFNLPHDSDSDPFQDDLSLKSKNTAGTDNSSIKRPDSKPSRAYEVPKLWVRRNGFFPQPPGEFRRPDNKVHPLPMTLETQTVVTQPLKSRSRFSRPINEQDSLEMLHFICGQHCPIL